MEFLVSGDVSPDFVIGYGCYSEVSKDKLIDMGIRKDVVKVIPKAYY